MKLLFLGTIVLLASAVYADHKNGRHHSKPSKPSPRSAAATAPHLGPIPKSHSFVRHARKLPQLHQPKLRVVPRKPSPRQSIQWKSKGPLRKSPLRKYPRRLPLLKSRQATGIPVPLPAFQNRPIQPIPSLRPVQVVPVQRNPRFRRLVTNLRQSASSLRQGIERGNSNLRQSFRSLPLPFRRPFATPGNQNRRKIHLPAIVFKRAEDMPGYERFTLDEVVYPEEESKIENRVDNEKDTILVDTPLDIDPRIKNKKSEETVPAVPAVKAVKKNDKPNPEQFGLRR